MIFFFDGVRVGYRMHCVGPTITPTRRESESALNSSKNTVLYNSKLVDILNKVHN